MKFTLTESAIKKLEELASLQTCGKTPLLGISVQGGGCSGMSYKMDWLDEYESSGSFCLPMGAFEVVIDPRSALFLNGTELDHSDGLDGKGFEFRNPIAKRLCGCGSSFSA